jgi:hypothetical protein
MGKIGTAVNRPRGRFGSTSLVSLLIPEQTGH